MLTRPGKGDRVPGIWIPGNGAPLLLVHPDGAQAARQTPQVADALKAGRPVLLIDAFQTGSAVAPRDRSHKFFLTFNRSDDANRVQDILTALAFLQKSASGQVTLVGLDKAAIWTTFAAAVAASPVTLQAPLGAFRGTDQDLINYFYVPGIQRAGGLAAALRLTSGMQRR